MNDKVVQVIILTEGASKQDEIYATLLVRLEDPDDYYTPQYNQNADAISGLAKDSIMAIWVTPEGQISFTGEMAPQGYGIIALQSSILLTNKL